MYQLENLIQHRARAAGTCVLVGFLGSVIGLVYGWSYIFDRIWFLGWAVGATWLSAIGVREWYSSATRGEGGRADTLAVTVHPAVSRTLKGSDVATGAREEVVGQTST